MHPSTLGVRVHVCPYSEQSNFYNDCLRFHFEFKWNRLEQHICIFWYNKPSVISWEHEDSFKELTKLHNEPIIIIINLDLVYMTLGDNYLMRVLG